MIEHLQSLVDLRGYDAERMLQLRPDDMPDRLIPTTVRTLDWINAPFEIRTVSASSIPGIAVGDRVLFSRVEKPDKSTGGAGAQ